MNVALRFRADDAAEEFLEFRLTWEQVRERNENPRDFSLKPRDAPKFRNFYRHHI